MTRSLAQLERTALNLLRQAFALGWHTPDLMMDYAADAMGSEHRALIGRVYAREFANHIGVG
jgi:hypothetical protein